MLRRFVKRSLRRIGIRLPFSDVICAEHVKSIGIGPDGRAKITVQEKLVFLEMPEMGDLHDECMADQETTFDNFIRHSPDSVEGGRRRLKSGAFVVDWMPSGPVTRYGMFEHEYSWFPANSHLQPALFAEFTCEVRTGNVLYEWISPQAFEAAVIFQRPRWPRLNTERRIVKYALKQIEAGAAGPKICDDGLRIEWRMAEPKIGTRYMCVVFHHNGMLLWNDDLQKNSIAGRMRRLVGRFAPG